MTRNSSVESGSAPSAVTRPPGTEVSLLSTPSSRKLLLRSRDPFTVMPPNRLLVCDVPGDSKTSSYGFRVIRGRSLMARSSTRLLTCEVSRSTVGNLIGAHLDFFGDRSRLQPNVQGQRLADGELNVWRVERLEARHLGRDFVDARRKRGNAISCPCRCWSPCAQRSIPRF